MEPTLEPWMEPAWNLLLEALTVCPGGFFVALVISRTLSQNEGRHKALPETA
jgi:hypothetical protein